MQGLILINNNNSKNPKRTFGAEMQEIAGRSWKWDGRWICLLCLRALLVFLQFLLLMDMCPTWSLKTIPDNGESATSRGKGINVFLWENFWDHQTSFFEASLKFGVTLPVNIWHEDQIIPFLLAAALKAAPFPGVCRAASEKPPAPTEELPARAPVPSTLVCSWLKRGAQPWPRALASGCRGKGRWPMDLTRTALTYTSGFSASLCSQMILLIIFYLKPLYCSDSIFVPFGLDLHMLLLDLWRSFGSPVQSSRGLLAFPVSCVFQI